jgi:hypothetical protein
MTTTKIQKVKLVTTLELLKKHDACACGLETLIKSLPKNYSNTKSINLLHILESNSLDHFFWAWRATTKKEKKVKRLILHDIIKEVQHIYEKRYPKSNIFKQVLKALSTGRGLEAACDASYEDACKVAGAACYAACDACYAAYNASCDEACYAARAACYAACDACHTAYNASCDKACDAVEHNVQIKIINKYLK